MPLVSACLARPDQAGPHVYEHCLSTGEKKKKKKKEKQKKERENAEQRTQEVKTATDRLRPDSTSEASAKPIIQSYSH